MSNRPEITKALTLSLGKYINPKNDPRMTQESILQEEVKRW